MKILISIILMIGILGTLVNAEVSSKLIETNIDISFSDLNNQTSLTINTEDDNYIIDLTNLQNYNKTFEISLIREFNFTCPDLHINELLTKFDQVADNYNTSLNYIKEYEACKESNIKLSYDVEKTLRPDITNLQKSLSEKEQELESMNSQKWLFGAGGALAAWLIATNSKKGAKTPEDQLPDQALKD